jgi:type IX secretion system PorP/SprF family membrane protein
MKKKIIFLALTLIIQALPAQQDYQFSMNMFNRLAINPAYAGTNKTLCATTFYRNQWTGFEGAPKTVLVSVDYGRILGGGLGLTAYQDQIGFQKILKTKLAYSYHQMLNIGTIAFGIDAGMIQQSIATDKLVAPTTNLDPSIPTNNPSGITYDFGAGVYYYTKRLYAGISSLQIPQSEIGKSSAYSYKTARHYYIMAGYTFKPNPMWEITPSIFTKSVFATTQLDLNTLVRWNKTLFAGLSYRLTDAAIVMAGVEHKFSRQLSAKLGYSYDITTSPIKKEGNGSHEIMFGFCYKFVPDGGSTSHMNVRFL